MRLRVGGAGNFSAVIDLPLSSSFTTFHGLFHSTGFLVARDAALLLAVVFYILITAVGLAIRMVGKGSISKTLDKQASTYWNDAKPVTDPARYYRQF